MGSSQHRLSSAFVASREAYSHVTTIGNSNNYRAKMQVEAKKRKQ